MKTKNEPVENVTDSELVQLNARVPSVIKSLHKSVAAASDLRMEDLAADALRFFYGMRSPELEKCREECVTLFKALARGKKLPFERPLTPCGNNSLTVVC